MALRISLFHLNSTSNSEYRRGSFESSSTKGLCTDPMEASTSSPVSSGRLRGCFFFSGTVVRLSPRCNVSRRGKWVRNMSKLFNVNTTSLTTNDRIKRPIGSNVFSMDVDVNRPSERLNI